MISLTPSATTQDAQGAFAILALLGDDNKYKQRLAELQAAAADAQAKLDSIAAAQVAADAKVADANAKLAQAQALVTEAYARQDAAAGLVTAANQRKSDLDLREVQTAEAVKTAEAERQRCQSAAEIDLAARAQALNDQSVKMTAVHRGRQTELDVAASALQAREAALIVKEQDAVAEASKLAARSAELEAKFGKLRALL